MDDAAYEKIMERWVAQEIAALPELRPSEDMYRKTKERRGEIPLRRNFHWKWTAAGAAVVAAVLFFVLLPDMLRRPMSPVKPSVGLRRGLEEGKGTSGSRGALPTEPKREKKGGGKKGGDPFVKGLFLYYEQGTEDIEREDIFSQTESEILLDPASNYRLAFEPDQDRFVYVFQVGSDLRLTRLFPNEAYQTMSNPLLAKKRYLIPPSPQWFFSTDPSGREILYIITSEQPLTDFDVMYDRYTALKKAKKRQALVRRLLEELLAVKEGMSEGAVLHTIVFRKSKSSNY